MGLDKIYVQEIPDAKTKWAFLRGQQFHDVVQTSKTNDFSGTDGHCDGAVQEWFQDA